MSAQIKDGGPVDVLADLQGVVRIAKAASLGVTGNKPRIERAEAAIAVVAEMIEVLAGLVSIEDSVTQGQERDRREEWIPKARAILARCGGAK